MPASSPAFGAYPTSSTWPTTSVSLNPELISSRVQLAFSGNKLNEHSSSDFIHIWRQNMQVDRKPITASRNCEDGHELPANVVPEQSGLSPINNGCSKITKHANRNNVQPNMRWKYFTEVDMMRQAARSFRLLGNYYPQRRFGFARLLYSVPELNLKGMTLRGPSSSPSPAEMSAGPRFLGSGPFRCAEVVFSR